MDEFDSACRIAELEATVGRLARELAKGEDRVYAPDGRTWQEFAYAEAAKRGEFQAEVERLRQGIEAYIAGDYESPRSHRPGKCQHGRNYWEECDSCAELHFQQVLAPSP